MHQHNTPGGGARPWERNRALSGTRTGPPPSRWRVERRCAQRRLTLIFHVMCHDALVGPRRKCGKQAGRQASDAKQRSKANHRRDRVGNSSAYTHPSSDDRNRKRLCHDIGVSLFLLLGSATWHFVRARCSERRQLSSHTHVC